MSGPRADGAAAARVPAPAGGRRLLFFMRAINYDRLFEGALRELLGRGHRIHVLLDVEKRGTAGDSALLDALRADFPHFSYGTIPARNGGVWDGFGTALRFAIDYLRYLEPLYENARALRERARARAPRLVVWLGDRIGRHRGGRRSFGAVLRVVEASLPDQRGARAFVEGFAPNAVLVTPLVGLGSPQGDYVRAARLFGAATVFPVASWDNLTNKGVIRDVPNLTIVWNEAQRREAVGLHGLPVDSVVVTGSHSFDHWFDWEPSTDRETFCTPLGLDPERPYLLYVGSSRFIARDEARFVARWIEQLRRSDEPELREANVVVRPHPANFAIWDETDPSEPGRVVIHPRDVVRPTTKERKSQYYDSIYHSTAVVGINTSALIESGILGRRVFTITSPEFRDTQEGTLHFAYLTGENGEGLVNVARDFLEHERQLATALREAGGSFGDSFVLDFLRPYGRHVAASPLFADAVECLAAEPSRPRRRPLWHALVRAVVAPFVYFGALAIPPLRRAGLIGGRRKPKRA